MKLKLNEAYSGFTQTVLIKIYPSLTEVNTKEEISFNEFFSSGDLSSLRDNLNKDYNNLANKDNYMESLQLYIDDDFNLCLETKLKGSYNWALKIGFKDYLNSLKEKSKLLFNSILPSSFEYSDISDRIQLDGFQPGDRVRFTAETELSNPMKKERPNLFKPAKIRFLFSYYLYVKELPNILVSLDNSALSNASKILADKLNSHFSNLKEVIDGSNLLTDVNNLIQVSKLTFKEESLGKISAIFELPYGIEALKQEILINGDIVNILGQSYLQYIMSLDSITVGEGNLSNLGEDLGDFSPEEDRKVTVLPDLYEYHYIYF